jgi:hypothetical protein
MTSTTPRALPTPTEESTERGCRVLWAIGEPDKQGYQGYAELSVTHRGRDVYAYVARLGTTRIRRDGVFVSEKFEFSRPSLPINREPAKRFSAARLAAFTAAARAAVEKRYAAGDPEVVALFGG